MLKKHCFQILLRFLIFITPAYSSSYEPDERINISVYEKINPAIVAIEAQVSDGVSSGTGCIVSKDGMILECNHVFH